MRSSLLPAAAMLLCAICAPSAAFAGGGGLYEPFPDPGSPEQVREFLERSPGGMRPSTRLTDQDIKRGTAVDPRLEPKGAAEASTRAGLRGGGDLLAGWPWALAALTAAVVAGVALSRLRA